MARYSHQRRRLSDHTNRLAPFQYWLLNHNITLTYAPIPSYFIVRWPLRVILLQYVESRQH